MTKAAVWHILSNEPNEMPMATDWEGETGEESAELMRLGRERTRN